ncbi:MAG: hypothetical protein IPM34_07640 [Saprospiraceae bacterium]|nr:hypothetical protein [Saprospiraceae bacterium]
MFVKFVFLLMIYLPLAGQPGILSEGRHPSSSARGRTGICQWNNTHSELNPALLSNLSHSSVSLYGKNYYFVKGLSNENLLVQFKLNENSGTSLLFSADGSKDYREFLLKWSYGRQLGPHTQMGLGFYGILKNQSTFSSSWVGNVQWGIMTMLLPDLLLGCVITNPFVIAQSTSNRLPFYFTAGINYSIYKGLEFLIELSKEGFTELYTSAGIQYQVSERIQIAVGIKTSGPQLSAGISYSFSNNFASSLAMENHPLLGLSINSGIDYLIKKN